MRTKEIYIRVHEGIAEIIKREKLTSAQAIAVLENVKVSYIIGEAVQQLQKYVENKVKEEGEDDKV